MIHKTKNKPNKKNNQTTTPKTKQTKRNKEGLGPSEVARKKRPPTQHAPNKNTCLWKFGPATRNGC